eukprot:1158817-Pelagomonas_calceolata.AAC.8
MQNCVRKHFHQWAQLCVELGYTSIAPNKKCLCGETHGCSGRKKASLLYVVSYVLSCATKHSPDYWVLMVGRILVGFSAVCGELRAELRDQGTPLTTGCSWSGVSWISAHLGVVGNVQRLLDDELFVELWHWQYWDLQVLGCTSVSPAATTLYCTTKSACIKGGLNAWGC